MFYNILKIYLIPILVLRGLTGRELNTWWGLWSTNVSQGSHVAAPNITCKHDKYMISNTLMYSAYIKAQVVKMPELNLS